MSEVWNASILSFSIAAGLGTVPLLYDFMTSRNPLHVEQHDIDLIASLNTLDIALYAELHSILQTRNEKLINFLSDFDVPDFHMRNVDHPSFVPLIV